MYWKVNCLIWVRREGREGGCIGRDPPRAKSGPKPHTCAPVRMIPSRFRVASTQNSQHRAGAHNARGGGGGGDVDEGGVATVVASIAVTAMTARRCVTTMTRPLSTSPPQATQATHGRQFSRAAQITPHHPSA